MPELLRVSSVPDIIDTYVRSSDYSPGQAFIGGKGVSARELTAAELAIFKTELAIIASRQRNQAIADLIARKAPRVLDLVRVVNYETKQGFKGAGARGNELILNPIRVGDVGRTTWFVSVTASGAANWIGSSASTRGMTVSSLPVLGHIYLGFVDQVATPKVDAVQLVKNGDPWPEEVLDFDWRGNADELALHELKQPWTIPPAENYYMPVRYYITGDDKLVPIAFAVKRATDVIAALA